MATQLYVPPVPARLQAIDWFDAGHPWRLTSLRSVAGVTPEDREELRNTGFTFTAFTPFTDAGGRLVDRFEVRSIVSLMEAIMALVQLDGELNRLTGPGVVIEVAQADRLKAVLLRHVQLTLGPAPTPAIVAPAATPAPTPAPVVVPATVVTPPAPAAVAPIVVPVNPAAVPAVTLAPATVTPPVAAPPTAPVVTTPPAPRRRTYNALRSVGFDDTWANRFDAIVHFWQPYVPTAPASPASAVVTTPAP